MAVKIIADSTCDLSPELLDRFHIQILPLYVNLEGKDYRDGVDITSEDIFRSVAQTGALPKTAAMPVSGFEEAFAKALEPDTEILCLTIGSKFSACYQNAVIAANENPNIAVVDSQNLSTGFGHVVLCAAEYAAKGHSAKETADYLSADVIPFVRASFIIDRLDYLYKGGRCSAVARLGANLLHLKPCIEVRNGEMGVAKKYRGTFLSCVEQYANERLENLETIDPHRVFVTHPDADADAVERAKEIVKAAGHFEEIYETRAGCTVSCHCGPNTLGVLYIERPQT